MALSEWARKRINPALPPSDIPRYVDHPGPVRPDVVLAYYELGAALLPVVDALDSVLDRAAADRKSVPLPRDVGYLVAHVRPVADRLATLLAGASGVRGLSGDQADRVRAAVDGLRAAAEALAGLGRELAPDYDFHSMLREDEG